MWASCVPQVSRVVPFIAPIIGFFSRTASFSCAGRVLSGAVGRRFKSKALFFVRADCRRVALAAWMAARGRRPARSRWEPDVWRLMPGLPAKNRTGVPALGAARRGRMSRASGSPVRPLEVHSRRISAILSSGFEPCCAHDARSSAFASLGPALAAYTLPIARGQAAWTYGGIACPLAAHGA